MLPEFEFCRKAFEANGLSLTSEVYEKLDIYAEMLVETNKVMNLTAITEPEDVLVKHFIDSIAITRFAKFEDGMKVIDVGTGAGFPLLPVKIYMPGLKITLLDGLNKRIKFLTDVCEKTGIEAECIHERAELLAKKDEYREKYDIATARAVSAMPELSEYCLPFVKKGGIFCAMKGPSEDISTAGNALKLLGGKIEKDEHYEINGEQRRLVVVKKAAVCPPKYPRASGKIKSKPL
ncbi:MAG: 16S rRNA (guanine(527)-N(7))-methyltransferase RsmG [Oscillospiraceae bacterium]|nr:16S rRNA (guanine(527)-N(7))-methyltransferase RsmG [Oscillospiraceae bacterium]MBR6924216.1 16S rRNA (guanine(527)-N(7))-methyltransferase RsmG [Oscillospiraceae bacterium]